MEKNTVLAAGTTSRRGTRLSSGATISTEGFPDYVGHDGPNGILDHYSRSVGDRLTRLPDIVLADLQAAEKAEQPITGPVAAGFAGWRCCSGECLLLHC